MRSIDRDVRSFESTKLHSARYAIALAVLIALTVSSFLIMRTFVKEERALDETMTAVQTLRIDLANQQISMRDLVAEMRATHPDEFRLRGMKRALAGSRERLVRDLDMTRATMITAEVGPTAWAILQDQPYRLVDILADIRRDIHVALEEPPAEGDPLEIRADPRQDGFLSITDSHATAALLAAEKLLDELVDQTEARKMSRERLHAWLGWATVVVLVGEASIIFWPLVGNLGREVRRADEATQELARLARHDSLTGLLNRVSLIREIEHAVAQTGPTRERLALMLIDLDRFKPINDMFGHAAGDGVLIEVARRLLGALRPRDVVARLGGDEFVVLLPQSGNTEEVRDIGNRIKCSLDREMVIEGHRLRLGASIGCAFWPEDARDVDGLLSAADLAMYHAKRNETDEVVFFDEELRSDVARVRSQEDDLRRGLAEEQLTLLYQPIVSLDGRGLRGFEALVRWNHPDLGMLEPDQFLAIAERAGLMSQVTTWVLDTACRQQASWCADGLRPGLMSINVPKVFLTQPDAIGQIAAIAESHRLPKAALALEISELSMSGDDHVLIAAQLDAAHAAGLRVTLDEFGLGPASLIHLRKPGIDILKVDRAFVRDLASAPETIAIVGAMIELARILDKQIVVEGIETAEQAALLAISERAWVQGYLYSRPLSTVDAVAFMTARADVVTPSKRLRATG